MKKESNPPPPKGVTRPQAPPAPHKISVSGSPVGSTAPWMIPPLNEWAIVGMNHYHVDGERRLFVSMAKDGQCIKAEGADDQYLWNKLWHQATEQ